MKTEPSALAEHLRRAIEADEQPAGSSDRTCPGAQEHLLFARGELEAEAAQRLMEHTATCAECRAESALARAFETDGDEPEAGQEPALDAVVASLRQRAIHRDPTILGPAAPHLAADKTATSRNFPRKAMWRVMIAASLVLIASISLRTWNELTPPPLPERVESGVTRGMALVGLEPYGALEAMPAEFRWTPVEGAVRYRVTLRAVDDRVLWQREVHEARATLPAAVIGLSSNVRYFWQVEGMGDDTRVLAISETVRFVVRPNDPRQNETGKAIALEASP